MDGLGDRLRVLRESRGMSMHDLAEACGVSRSYVWRLENDQRQLNTRLIGKLAKALKIEPAVLIGGESHTAVHRRQETLLGHLLAVRTLNPRFVEKVLGHILEDFLPDDPELRTIRDWDGRLLDLGTRGTLLDRLMPRAGEIADHLDLLDKAMDYAEFRRRMLKSVASWPRERRERFVADLLPEILRQPGRYRRLTGEEIFREGRPETDRLARFPLLLDGDDPRTAILGRSGAIDLASQMSGESRFAFRMPDDSMAPRYAKGTILVADSDRQTDDGRPAIVGLADLPTTCRIVRREGSEVRFTPLNGQFPESVHPVEDLRWAHPVMRSIGE
jgi:transcriptional regulator with XRE-family HTH domain